MRPEPPAPSEAEPSRTVLVVDDDPLQVRLVATHLVRAGYRVRTAGDGHEAIAAIRAEVPDAIVTDWTMPGMDGCALVEAVRGHPDLPHVFIVMMTASTERDRVVQALDAGADDFVFKPIAVPELLARVRAGIRMLALQRDNARQALEIARAAAELEIANRQLAEMNRRLDRLSLTDELTGLANRRAAMGALERVWAISLRKEQPVSCVLFDIDHFKRINDTLGHDAGDDVLRAVAERVRGAARAGEEVYRVGGEEFLLICPGTAAEGAAAAAERLRRAVAQSPIATATEAVPVTVSLGVADRAAATSAEALLKAADEALYAAKRGGRDRVAVAGRDTVRSAA